jgi:hypothetical protein
MCKLATVIAACLAVAGASLAGPQPNRSQRGGEVIAARHTSHLSWASNLEGWNPAGFSELAVRDGRRKARSTAGQRHAVQNYLERRRRAHWNGPEESGAVRMHAPVGQGARHLKPRPGHAGEEVDGAWRSLRDAAGPPGFFIRLMA